jgi:hypothetical protein
MGEGAREMVLHTVLRFWGGNACSRIYELIDFTLGHPIRKNGISKHENCS